MTYSEQHAEALAKTGRYRNLGNGRVMKIVHSGIAGKKKGLELGLRKPKFSKG